MFGRVADNLADYLRGAVLPRMAHDIPETVALDPRLKSTLNNLAVEPAGWRKLMNIVSFRDAYAGDKLDWEGNCRLWLDEFFPSGYRRGLQGDEFSLVTVPNSKYRVKTWGPDPDSISRSSDPAIPSRHHLNSVTSIARWVERYPLHSAQYIIHQCFPYWRDYSWRPLAHGSEDEADLWKMFVWTQEPVANLNFPAWIHGVVVAVQPPWALTEADLRAVSQGGALNVRIDPDMFDEGSDGSEFDVVDMPASRPGSKWSMKSRIWAKLWDACVMQGCYYFILTSYKHWIFGRFSNRRTIGYISEVVPYNVKGPTILERLIYWVGVAADPKTHIIPEIQEPFDGINDPADDKMFRDTVLDAIRGMRRFPPPPSGFDWEDGVSEIGSSAGVTFSRMAVSEIGSFAGSEGDNDIGNLGEFIDGQEELYPDAMEDYEIEPATPTTRALMLDEEEVANWLLNTPDTPRMEAANDSDLESIPDSDDTGLTMTRDERVGRNLRAFNALPPYLPRPLTQPPPPLDVPFCDPNRVPITGGLWMV